MKVKFTPMYRGLLLFLVLLGFGGLWSCAFGATNAVSPETAPVRSPAWFQDVEQLQRHHLTFGLDEVPVLKERSLLGEPLWKYCASLLYIGLALVTTKVIDYVVCVWLKRLASKTQTRLDDLLLELLHGPIKVVVFVVLLNVGLNVFNWSERAKLYLFRGLVVVVAASLTYLAVKVVGLLLDIWQERIASEDRRFNNQLFTFLRKTLNAFIVVVAILVTAQNIGINMTAAITSLSIGGLAVGLAAQDTLANFFGAIAVLTDKPFQVGDSIRIENVEGTVETVGLRSTKVRNLDGFLVAVPNKTMGNAIITNISRRPRIRTVVNVALSKWMPTEKVRRAVEILEKVYSDHPVTRDVTIVFNQVTGGNLNIQVVHLSKDTQNDVLQAALQEINLNMKQQFDAEGIMLA
jgi:MscS family membrane protein